ncbi:tetratricopeptide repeat protein [Neisseria montereyensis]|uniref:Tetratricopeptide repeat protein n=1 Tax=Neisseria montereyensis TaxID=2973938 RepID=A0ABT2FF38_9NEIS|nr:hypothetical protein [Neisseria montereyensis]MCS4534745.1 hypothetical protein [Neisseria montereyensis]
MKKRLTPQQQKIQQQLDKISVAFRHYMAMEQYQQAVSEALKAHKLIPQAVAPLSDAATAAVKGELWQEGISYAKKALQRNPDHINSLDALAHAYGALHDWENCRLYGRQALENRNRNIKNRPPQPDISIKSSGKKIISFSLFGNHAGYIEPAVINTELASIIYPGWVCRFYVDGSVPEQALQRLRQHGAEIVRVSPEQEQWPGTMWRFLAINDSEAERVIFRDADSVISQREAHAVEAWINSGKRFHTMRDAGTHTELILAGLWGAIVGSVPNIETKITAYLSKPVESRHFADQFFLRENVWPYVCQSLCAHDRIFGFFDAHPFPDTEPFDYDHYHVGCNEGNVSFQANPNLPDGSRVIWRLFSRISPLLNPDYSINLLSEERLVCAYETTVQNGFVSGVLPRRYSLGFSDGLSKITVAAIT